MEQFNLNYIPDQLIWADQNPCSNRTKHREACSLLYKLIVIENLNNDRFRIGIKFFQCSDNDINTIGELLKPINKDPYGLFCLSNWAQNPPTPVTRDHIEALVACMDKADINDKIVTWHHNQLIKNKQPNQADPAKPKLLDSFYEFLRSISLTCKYLITKTIKAKNYIKKPSCGLTKSIL